MIHDKLRNYDVAKTRHHTNMSSVPSNIDALPEFQHASERKPDVPSNHSHANSDNDSISPEDNADDDSARCDTIPRLDNKIRRAACVVPPHALWCGVLPSGTALYDSHAPPLKASARNSEATYWKDFDKHVRQAFPEDLATMSGKVSQKSWHVSSLTALEVADKQKHYFKALVRCKSTADETLLYRAAPPEKNFRSKLVVSHQYISSYVHKNTHRSFGGSLLLASPRRSKHA